MAAGDIRILANLNRDDQGSFLFTNAYSTISATGWIHIGGTTYGAGTPVNLVLEAGVIESHGAFSATATGDITLRSIGITAAANLTFAAYGDIAIDGGILTSHGAQLALLADTDRDNHGSVSLTGSAQLSADAASASLVIAGYTVSIASSASLSPTPNISQYKK